MSTRPPEPEFLIQWREWIVRGEAMPYYTARIGESPTIRAQVAPGRWDGVPRRSEDNE